MAFLMNAFIYLVPIYCGARGLVDLREGRRNWAIIGGIAALVLIVPPLSAFLFPASEATGWLMLGFLFTGSVGVLAYVAARAYRDLVERRLWWALYGFGNLILLCLPWAGAFLVPANQVTIG